jgi:hypothetical protein
MNCNEIQEHLIDLLYDESGPTPANVEVRNHLQTCPACRSKLEELKQTRIYLQGWKDESPLRSVAIARREKLLNRGSGWKYVRYAAIAAMALICIMALTNTELTLNKDGFSFSTHLFAPKTADRDYYTKSEVRGIMDDIESRMKEINYVMAQRVLDTVEQERYMDLHLTGSRSEQNRNRN